VSPERLARANVVIALAVGVGAAVSPRLLLRAYGVPASEVTGAAVLGWRLFAMRNLAVGVAAWRGDESARAMFLPVQVLDQMAFASAYSSRDLPRPAVLAAMATSGAIVAMDVLRRRGSRQSV
jgi:hypothetical protein